MRRPASEPWDAALHRRERAAGPCLDEGLVVAFYSGELGEDGARTVRHHLSECRPCLELARDAQRFVDSMEAPLPNEGAGPASRPWGARWQSLAAAASVTLALAAGWWWWARGPTGPSPTPGPPAPPPPAAAVANPWADLPVPRFTEARPAEPADLAWRDTIADAPSPAAADAFAAALQAYQRDDLAEAERRLAELLRREPRRAEAHFYRGVCLLALGRNQDAVAALERARDHSRGAAREAALFYLALGHLKAGAPDRALPLLDALHGSPRHGPEAERLRQQVLAARGR